MTRKQLRNALTSMSHGGYKVICDRVVARYSDTWYVGTPSLNVLYHEPRTLLEATNELLKG